MAVFWRLFKAFLKSMKYHSCSGIDVDWENMRLATGADDGLIKIWDLASGEALDAIGVDVASDAIVGRATDAAGVTDVADSLEAATTTITTAAAVVVAVVCVAGDGVLRRRLLVRSTVSTRLLRVRRRPAYLSLHY